MTHHNTSHGDAGSETNHTRRRLLQTGGVVGAVLLAGCSGGDTEPTDAETNTPVSVGTENEPQTATETEPGTNREPEPETENKAETETAGGWPLPRYDKHNSNFNPDASFSDSEPVLETTVSLAGIDERLWGSIVTANTLVVSSANGAVATLDLADLSQAQLTSLPPGRVTGGRGLEFFLITFKSAEVGRGLGLYSLEGTKKWHRSGEMGITHQVLYARDRLYAAIGSAVECLDAETGERVWRINPIDAARDAFSDQLKQRIATYEEEREIKWHQVEFGVAAGVLVVGFSNGISVALDAADGTYRWHYVVKGFNTSPPVIADGTVIVTRGGVSRADEPLATAGLNIADGSERWTVTSEFLQPPVSGTSGGVMFQNGRSRIFTRLTDSGQLGWMTPESPFWQSSSDDLVSRTSGGGRDLIHFVRKFIINPDDVESDDVTGELRAFDSDSGTHRWTKRITGHKIIGKPLLISDRVLLGTEDGQILLYKMPTE